MYKRQAYGQCAGRCEQDHYSRSGGVSARQRAGTAALHGKPVSYTHLDVYKRQVGMLSKRIRELRFSLGLNQVQFGQALNVTKQTISNWENDNIQPSVEMLIKIVNTYSSGLRYGNYRP